MFSVDVDWDGSSVGTLETAGAALSPETSAIRGLGALSMRTPNRVNTHLDVEVDRIVVQPSLRQPRVHGGNIGPDHN